MKKGVSQKIRILYDKGGCEAQPEVFVEASGMVAENLEGWNEFQITPQVANSPVKLKVMTEVDGKKVLVDEITYMAIAPQK